jgi:hypothetical protein
MINLASNSTTVRLYLGIEATLRDGPGVVNTIFLRFFYLPDLTPATCLFSARWRHPGGRYRKNYRHFLYKMLAWVQVSSLFPGSCICSVSPRPRHLSTTGLLLRDLSKTDTPLVRDHGHVNGYTSPWLPVSAQGLGHKNTPFHSPPGPVLELGQGFLKWQIGHVV